MSFFKEHNIKLPNSEKEYILIIKVEKDDDKSMFFNLYNNQDFTNENYQIKIKLEELKLLNKIFRIFDSMKDCAETISNVLKNSNPKIIIEKNGASLIIDFYISGMEKKNQISIFLKKQTIEPNMCYKLLLDEINKLTTKVNDLEILVNSKNKKINEIEKNYEELKQKHKLLEEQHNTDIINLKSLIPNQNNNNNNNNNINPNLKTFEEQQKSNNNEQSTIINNLLELNFLGNQFRLIYPGKNVIYNLLYRKSRDSDKASVFHSKCDKIRGTLILIKTVDNLKFGGYTNETWEGDNVQKADNTAFIFSLNNNKAYKIKKNKKAIFCSPLYGPCFCGNNAATIIIHDNSDKEGGECSKAIDSNYDGFVDDYEINRGKSKFKISDIEVFKVTIV